MRSSPQHQQTNFGIIWIKFIIINVINESNIILRNTLNGINKLSGKLKSFEDLKMEWCGKLTELLLSPTTVILSQEYVSPQGEGSG